MPNLPITLHLTVEEAELIQRALLEMAHKTPFEGIETDALRLGARLEAILLIVS